MLIDNTKEIQKSIKKPNSISKIKPKGDMELKNINYRFSDKRYVGRKMINGKNYVVYAKTQKECADKLKKKINELKKGIANNEVQKKYLFKDLYMKWYNNEKKPFIKEKTQKDILSAFKNLSRFHDMNITKITRDNLSNYFLATKDCRTKEKTRLYLNAFLDYSMKEGVIKVNPCANIKVLKSNNRKKAFTYEQQKTILENLPKELKPVILVYLITGLRKYEFDFKNIEKNIDFENRILKAINLKGRNFVKRYKLIKLSKQAISLIMNNLDIIHKYNAESCYRKFASFLKEQNIKGSIVNCRHTFATNCFYLEKQDVTISREMGHNRTQITKDIYTDIDYHLSKEKILKLYNNLYNEN